MNTRNKLVSLPVFWSVVMGATLALAQEPAKQPLPLSKVVMFNSGVGYFEHRGQVDGDAQIDLRFRTEDINDLLKSMILEDAGGGTISTVSYGSRDPMARTLQSFPIDLTGNPTLGQLLDQIRGERVQVEAPNAITGVLLGVEKRRKEVGQNRDIVESEFINLLTPEGLRTIAMESISRIKLLDEKLDADLRQALQVLATGHDADKKTVTLNMQGRGARPVRVAYIHETPVWKTSYRLVVNDNEAPFLQGWAIVENTTESDWNDVNLTLVSGRPISYRMDLYEPLYVKRPLETLNLFASLRAQTYGQDMVADEAPFRGLADREKDQKQLADLQRSEQMQESLGRPVSGRGGRGGMGGGMPPAAPSPRNSFGVAMDAPAYSDAIRADQLARQSATAGEVGELFQYAISTPVTLARQKSAMLPIVNEKVKGEKVSIYNESVQVKHPLNGLRLENTTDLHLMQGPVTVFEGGAYAGDAKIDDLAPKADRLISYALDLKTEVAPENRSHADHLQSVKLIKGLMHVSRKLAREKQYTVKNSDNKTKTVLIEHALDPNWKLTAPEKPAEKTRDRYRFSVQAEPGKPATLTVAEEQVVSQQLALTNLDDGTIMFYINQREVSPAVKSALQEIVKRKQAIEKVVRERMQQEQQIAAINGEQERIRQNMSQLDRNGDLYKRYVQKFGQQEDEVEKMRTQIRTLTAEETRLRQALDQYLIDLNVV